MKYVAIWLGVVAALSLAAILVAFLVGVAAWVMADQQRWWIPAAFGTAFLFATLVTVVEYLTDQPKKPKVPPAA